MLPPPLRAPLAVLIACVAAISAAPAVSTVPSLSVRTSTSNVNLDGSENFKVAATIANTSDGAHKLLNDPRGVLNSFTSGSRPPFTSDTADYDPVHAANLDHPNTFTVLASGDSINVTHDIPAAYNLAQSGTEDYSVEPSNVFNYIDADGIPKGLYATVDGIAKVKLSSDPAVSRNVHDKRMTSALRVTNCPANEKEIFTAAIENARNLLSLTYRAFRLRTPDEYVTWFGERDSSREKTVKNIIKAAKNTILGYPYRCGCEPYHEGGTGGMYHERWQDGTLRRILLCRQFFANSNDREAVGIQSALLRLGIPFTVDDTNHARDLARQDPAAALETNTNYIYFVRDVVTGVP